MDFVAVSNNLWYQEKIISKLGNHKLNDVLMAQIGDIWSYTESFQWWLMLHEIRLLGLIWDFVTPVPVTRQEVCPSVFCLQIWAMGITDELSSLYRDSYLFIYLLKFVCG